MMFPKLTQRQIYISIAIVGFLVTGVAVYFIVKKRRENGPNKDDKPEDNQKKAGDGTVAEAPADDYSSGVPTLVFFHATWCPHCTKMAPEWSEVEKALKGKIQTFSIESKDSRINGHVLKGFPTIRFFPLGLVDPKNFADYTGERTAPAILDFINHSA